MYKQILAASCVLATLAGCGSTTVQNPVDYVTYRDQPLVKQVENGMTRQQVLTIGGEPSTTVQRKVNPGTCNNYVLTKDGHQQVYHVSFNSDGRVVHKGFMTCEQREQNEKAM
ncbi:osmotically-inducible lipoprotein OsmE [Pseudomonas sp. 21LCFQ02]|uniref:osmotically-inducible lipoprotein OsmE n=1 Tax=unclassified Pseudomonas TaxID=196821 RepID=UPI0004F92E52|nr:MULTISPECIES: osmotically-inducible lipoprotein OsmE [unclassified Pseudomonas]MCO8162749.1 osmotically-inducible lipoprotein OsmE [Pseudomonas sp. 21LCFQ010]MCO8170935.1 osmotically-inducible lipoprotein OsmE [Pseudomonas sp. 21LCFQ02]MCQ9425769.1 osmotically-inducible lipoprotein OsmE [Pseudomonas sp. LJDD11]BAP43101.1 DNA-binding transcriptional activator OsmE [Pseudomonas sp. StFLB209]